MTGIVKTKKQEGFGFITPDEGGKDLFFHMSAVVKPLSFDDISEGDKVSFETEDSEKGPRAVNVERA